MNWIAALQLLVKAADSLAFFAKAVNEARANNTEVDLTPFRQRDDAVSRAVVAEIEKQRAEAGSG